MSTAAAQQTARMVAALESALADAGHDVKVPDRPTVGQLEPLCRLLGVKVSQLFARVEAQDCPAWCTGSHPANDPGHHVGTLHSGGGITLNISQGLGQPVAVWLPDDVSEGLTVERARALAAALTMAARMTDEGGQP